MRQLAYNSRFFTGGRSDPADRLSESAGFTRVRSAYVVVDRQQQTEKHGQKLQAEDSRVGGSYGQTRTTFPPVIPLLFPLFDFLKKKKRKGKKGGKGEEGAKDSEFGRSNPDRLPLGILSRKIVQRRPDRPGGQARYVFNISSLRSKPLFKPLRQRSVTG